MTRWLVMSCLKFRSLVLIIAGVVMLVCVSQLRMMPVDVLPEFSLPFVEIQTEALGLSAEEVEQMITVPLEQDLLAGVAWLDVMRSESVPGLSSVLIYFEPGTDLYRARQMVSERLAQAAVGIPNVSKPPAMIQPTSSASRVIFVGLSSDKLSLIELGVLARWTIAPRLLGVPGVANVAIWGNRDRQLQVLVDPEQLMAQGVLLEQIIETTGNALWVSPLSFLEASSPGTGGFIDSPNQRLGIWHVLPISSPNDLAQIPVEGSSLILTDVALIVEDNQPLIGDAILNERPNILLVIEKLPGTNALEVTKGVEEALNVLEPGFSDIKFDSTLFRPATFIEIAITNITRALVLSALLVVLVLSAVFFGWRAALICLVAIMISVMSALLVLYLRGATLNSMVLAGLVVALGIIVDDAIVNVENIVERFRQNRSESNPAAPETIILEASVEMRDALFFVTLAAMLAILPVFFVDGTAGAVFQSLAVTYVLGILSAMVVGLTITPVLALLLFPNPRFVSRESPLVIWFRKWYQYVLVKTLRRPVFLYGFAVVLVTAGLLVIPALSLTPMLPAFHESYLMVELESMPSISQPEMNRIVGRMSGELRSLPGVSSVGAHVGRAVLGDRVIGINSAEIWVGIDSAANYDATVAAVHETVDGYPGLRVEVGNYLQESLRPSKISTSDPFTVRIYGEDHDILTSEVEKVQKILAGVSGIVDSHSLLPPEEPTLEIKVDLAKAQHYGIKPGDVRRAAATLISGLQVGSLFEEQKVFDVVVWGTPKIRKNLTTIREILIDTPGGDRVPLGEVADVSITSAPIIILREATSPYIDIGFDIKGRDVGSTIIDIKTELRNHKFPLEYHAEVQEDYIVQQSAKKNIAVTLLLVAAGIFLLLQATFTSWRLALVAFLIWPIALTGGLLAAFLTGETISMAALFGLLAVFGICTRNSVILVKHYQSRGQDGGLIDSDLVLRASLERMTPLLMTALTITLTLLPLAIFKSYPGFEILGPMVVVIIGGLATSTFANLIVLPALYLRFGSSRGSDHGFQPVNEV